MALSCVERIKKDYLTTFVGIVVASLGITLLALHLWIPNYFFTSIFVLKPNSPIINLWLKNPMELRMNFYFFNWTNPEEFYNLDVKPKFNQVGPYTYLFDVEKINLKWNSNNNTVTYETLRIWSLIDEHKNACVNDNITTVNTVTVFATSIIKNWSYLMKRLSSTVIALKAPSLQMVARPQQLLFEGSDNPLVAALPYLAPQSPYMERFAWLVLINGTPAHEGICNSGIGVNGDFSLLRWNYESHSPYFNGGCSKVHGSTGEMFNTSWIKDYVGLFVPILGRYLKFDFEREIVVDGILGHKFSAGSSLFDNGTRVKGNDCYCNGECVPSGMLNLSSCLYNFPIYGSLPHYLSADPIYLNSVEGLKPEKINHEAYIVVEPNTGIPIEVLLRLQVNVIIEPIEGVTVVEDARKIFFPLWWFEQKFELPRIITVLLKMYPLLPYVLVAVGLLLLILGAYLLLFKTFKAIVYKFLNKNEAYDTDFTQIGVKGKPQPKV